MITLGELLKAKLEQNKVTDGKQQNSSKTDVITQLIETSLIQVLFEDNKNLLDEQKITNYVFVFTDIFPPANNKLPSQLQFIAYQVGNSLTHKNNMMLWLQYLARLLVMIYGLPITKALVYNIPKTHFNNKTDYLYDKIKHIVQNSKQNNTPILVFGFSNITPPYTFPHVISQVDWDLLLQKTLNEQFKSSLYEWKKLVYYRIGSDYWTVDGTFISKKHNKTLWILKTLFGIRNVKSYVSRENILKDVNMQKQTEMTGFVIDRTLQIIPLYHIHVS